MTRAEAIKILAEPENDSEIKDRLERLENKFDLILSCIVVQQKDACEAIGISPDTVRKRVLSGEIEILQADGSRLNFLTLKTTGKLQPRKKLKRKR